MSTRYFIVLLTEAKVKDRQAALDARHAPAAQG